MTQLTPIQQRMLDEMLAEQERAQEPQVRGGSFLPLRRDESSPFGMAIDFNYGVPGMVKGALETFGDAAYGRTPVFDGEGNLNPEIGQSAAELATTFTPAGAASRGLRAATRTGATPPAPTRLSPEERAFADSRSSQLDAIQYNADLQQRDTGRLPGDTIRNDVRGMLTNDPTLTAGERQALEGVMGNPLQRAIRRTGERMVGGQHSSAIPPATLGAAGGAGAALMMGLEGAGIGAAGIAGAGAVRAVGGALRGQGSRATQRAFREADEIIRTRGPLYQQTARELPMIIREAGYVMPNTASGRLVLIRALIAEQLQGLENEREAREFEELYRQGRAT